MESLRSSSASMPVGPVTSTWPRRSKPRMALSKASCRWITKLTGFVHWSKRDSLSLTESSCLILLFRLRPFIDLFYKSVLVWHMAKTGTIHQIFQYFNFNFYFLSLWNAKLNVYMAALKRQTDKVNNAMSKIIYCLNPMHMITTYICVP